VLASFLPLHENTSDQNSDQPDMPLDIEFENEWETTSDWNEDDDEATTQETNLCFGKPVLQSA
jgi:CTD kinase subunit gamma